VAVRILFDSHALFWFLDGDPRFSSIARAVLTEEDAVGCVSAVTPWEIANEVRIGRWPEAANVVESFFEMLTQNAFEPVPISLEHARLAGLLPGPHRDPFDRMLAAQAQIEEIPLVTADRVFQAFGVRTLW
jgi:PIN domain nuclease of toxin-antitoxin system